MPKKKTEERYEVKTFSSVYQKLKTEKQWIKEGLILADNAHGIILWANGTHLKKARYYDRYEVKRPSAMDYFKMKTQVQSAEKKLSEIEAEIAKADLSEQTKEKFFSILTQE